MASRIVTILAAWVVLLGGSPLATQPLRVHPQNPRYLEYQGKLFLPVTSAEHYGAVLNSDFNASRYLNTLAKEGMNYTRVFTGTYVEGPGSFGIRRNTLAPAEGRLLTPWARSTVPGYAAGGNQFDLSEWNPAYFARLREFVAEAQRLGIVVEVTFFSSIYNADHWKIQPFHPSNNINGTELGDYRLAHTLRNGNLLGHQERLVRKLVRELNEFDNLFFEVQNEPWADQEVFVNTRNPYLRGEARTRYPNSIDLPSEASLDWHEQVMRWVADEESKLPKKHLQAFNYCNFYHPVHRIPELASIVNFHYAYPEAVHLNRGLGKLIGYDESGFQEGGEAVYRKDAWRFLLAGGGLFNSLDYSFSVGKEDGTDLEPNGPGGGSPRLRRHLRILREFLEGFDLAGMHPDDDVVQHAPGSFVQALSKPGMAYAMHVDATPQARRLELLLPAGRYRAEWVNPESGVVLHAESLQAGANQAVLLALPKPGADYGLRLNRE
ncbi:MAG: hypothetical protein MUF01_09360 [Bryobacterales bacterium]|nr:hypothetical protein [Bryobacterales bacterium]